MVLELKATPRDATGTKAVRKLRAEGKLPAIVYGSELTATPITLTTSEFEKVWREAGESTVLVLKGVVGAESVLIYHVAVDPVYETPVHVDLYAVSATHEVEVEVPVVFEGTSPAEKELGGTLIKVMHSVAIRALPKDLPHELTIDTSSLKTFDDQLLASDITLPDGVTLVTDREEIVALVQAPREEEPEEAPVDDVASVEVEKKGKEEESEDEQRSS